jgi:starch synthase
MKVLFLAAEATPYIKVGGLGDVAGALPQALRRLGADVKLMLPRHGSIDVHKLGMNKAMDNFPVHMDWRHEACQLMAANDTDFFVENDRFFGSRFKAYGYDDDPTRYVLFARAALEACRLSGWNPDIVHAHDWHSAAAIRLQWSAHNRAGLVFTIHNIAHQGMCSNSNWPLLGVYDAQGHLNLMEQAIYAADVVTTVSPTYAREIQSRQYGFGLDGLLRQRDERLVGIVNGIDMDIWNPATDPLIPARFQRQNLEGKRKCKMELQRRQGLEVNPDVPLIGVVSRLDDQKGIDLIVQSLGDIWAFSNAQFMVLGSGHEPYENAFRAATWQHGDRMANWIGFNNEVSHLVYAASDIFLMPSSFEPCGISQMIAMRYGALPVVRSTGGLVDTVPDVSRGDGVGYRFDAYDKSAMLHALGRALHDYHNQPRGWAETVQRAMSRDFSWATSARRYAEVYHWARELSQR